MRDIRLLVNESLSDVVKRSQKNVVGGTSNFCSVCGATTSEKKPFCIEHIDHMPVVADVQSRIERLDLERANIEGLKKGPRSLWKSGAIVGELLKMLKLQPMTTERAALELGLSTDGLKKVVRVLKKEGSVKSGRTKRGATVVWLVGDAMVAPDTEALKLER